MRNKLLLPIGLIAALPTLSALAGTYNDAGPAVIQIHVYGTLNQRQAAGSADFDNHATGFIVSPDGLIMTAGHVAPDPDQFKPGELWMEGRLPKPIDMAMVADDPIYELARIKSSTSPHDVGLFRIKRVSHPLHFLRLCDQYTVDDHLTVLGYSGGKDTLSKSLGSVRTPAVDPNPLVMQMPLSPGDSGGPVFNDKGTVFAIAVGEEHVNNERLSETTLAVTMRNAMAEMSPESRQLIGLSYDPDCGKALPQVSRVDSKVIEQGKTSSMFAAAAGSKFSQVFEAPPGYIFKDVLKSIVTSSSPLVSATAAQVKVIERGHQLELTIQTKRESPTLAVGPWEVEKLYNAEVNGKILAEIVPLQPEPITAMARREAEVRSFPISRTLDRHEPFAIATQDFDEFIPVPLGYKFTDIVNVDHRSVNHSPSNGLHVKIVQNGLSLGVGYSLSRGPAFDRWRGWVDAIITAKLIPDR